jgi:uncharacterized protein with HEPN domain
MEAAILRYLFDIKTSIDAINEFLGEERQFTHYVSHKMLRRAVERELEIIGEALSQMEKLDPSIPITGKKKGLSA